METQGRRVYPDEKGNLPLREGDYGLHPDSGWQVRPPGCHAGGISKHEVEEHEDGTITVSPSIVLYDINERGETVEVWHGYLHHGIWKTI
jgi:hypothetical protein